MIDKLYNTGELHIKSDEWGEFKTEFGKYLIDNNYELCEEELEDMAGMEYIVENSGADKFKVIVCDMTAVGLWLEAVR